MRLYVAGPMRGYPMFNFPKFDHAARVLRTLGHEVFNPAEHDRETYGDDIADAASSGDEAQVAESHGFDLRAALGADLAWIAANADGVAVLPGWRQSKGARAEVALAHALGIVVAPFEAYHETYHITPYDTAYVIDADETTQGEGSTAGGEVRVVASTGGEKGSKPARFDLIPAGPLWQLAELYGKGAEKYAPRNWERGYDWSLSFAAMMRHAWLFWSGVDLDDETGMPHLASVAWHAFALMEWAVSHPEFDNRPNTPNVEPEARLSSLRDLLVLDCNQ